MVLCSKSAELIGMHIGDGTLYKTTRGKVWELRGGRDETKYYEYISNLLKDIFQLELIPKYRAGGTYGIQTSNKKIVSFFLENGMPIGSKTYTITIPDRIFKNNSLALHCIRGIFDTDGCINFDSPNRPKTYNYPRIILTLASHKIIEQIQEILVRNGFNACVYKDRKYLRLVLRGKENLEKWMKTIGFSNPKHFKKHTLWKKQGYYAGIA